MSLLKEILPLEEAISVSGLKNRVRAVGQGLDDRIEQTIKDQVGAARCPSRVTALAVDSAWLKHCEPPRYQDRHVNIVAGRATHEDGGSRVYAYVTKEVSAPAARLDHFLCENGVGLNEPVTVISDGGAEFEKAVNGSKRPLNRILDWFHIAMKFRAIEQSALKHRDLSAPSGRPIERDIAGAKWLLWHGRASKAIARLKQLHDMFGLVPEPPYQTLWWNLRGTCFYLEANKRYLVNYGARYRSGLPISSGIAESAVNQVVSARFAKKRQMRWSDEGAHLLAQIRVQLLNGELRPRAAPIPLRYPKPEADPSCTRICASRCAPSSDQRI